MRSNIKESSSLIMQNIIQTKAEDLLKDFKKLYKLYKVDVSEHRQTVEPIDTKNHELTIKMICNKLRIYVEFNYEIDGIYADKSSAWVDGLSLSGHSGESIGFFKSQKDAANAALLKQIENLNDELRYHSKICDDLKTKINNYQKNY